MEPLDPPPDALDAGAVEAATSLAERIGDNIRRAVKVRDDALDRVVISLLAEGHVLV